MHRTNSVHELGAKAAVSRAEILSWESIGHARQPPRHQHAISDLNQATTHQCCTNDAFRKRFPRHQRRRVRPDAVAAPQPQLVLRAEDEPNLVTKGAWFAAELAGKAKAALGGSMERGPATAPPRSVAEAVKRIEADYEGEPYFLTGKMDAGCCQ